MSEKGQGPPWPLARGKGLMPDFSVFFIFFVYDTLPYTKTIRDEEKRDTDQKAPFFLSDLSWAPKSPGVVPTFCFCEHTDWWGAQTSSSIIHKKCPVSKRFCGARIRQSAGARQQARPIGGEKRERVVKVDQKKAVSLFIKKKKKEKRKEKKEKKIKPQEKKE